MNEPITRTTGQSAMLPGTVSVGDLVWTSGLVSPSALAAVATGAEVPARQQIIETLALLRTTLDEAGVSADRVVRIDAYVSDAGLVPVWNELYVQVWPEPGPARITLVAGFVSPAIHFELMATAVR
jgi:2-iminobutanoate/2-iminopropanoate deaminase